MQYSNDGIYSAYATIGCEIQTLVLENIELDDTELVLEDISTNRPSDTDIRGAIKSEIGAGQRIFNSTTSFAHYNDSIDKLHKKKVSVLKDLVSTLGDKVTSSKIKSEDGSRIRTVVNVDGHPVAEVVHYPEARTEADHNHWNKRNKFTQAISIIPKAFIDLHKEHLQALKQQGSKEKPQFINSSIIVTKLGKPKTSFVGHGSAGSIKTATPSLISKIVNGVPVHKIQDSWDTYD